ncbi:MAG: von Willebrand factor type A domain-containing protein [Myxococcota bacterium]|jgi:Ca-activated chloride channel family protein|nr:von Willebrand factor type A domain-containing protein [Myxococcota bacterium]
MRLLLFHILFLASLGACTTGCMAMDDADQSDIWDTEPGDTDGSDTGLPDPHWQDVKGPDSDSEPDDTNETDPQCEWPAGIYYLSSDDSNSMASPVLARSFIEGGLRVPRAAVRVHEFLNYFDLGLPKGEGDALGLFMAMRTTSMPDEHELLVTVSAPNPLPARRRPLSLTLSIDTSTSMQGIPLGIAQSACQTLARSLDDGDVLSIVTWSTTQNVVLDSWPIAKKSNDQGEQVDPQVELLCSQLQAGGATNLHLGLVSAIELAGRNASPGRTSRIVLISDGRANAGFADVETIAKRAERSTGGQVLFMGAGVGGAATYRDTLMNLVTDAGKGAYVFLDSDAEARKVFGEQLLRHVDIAARDVSVALHLPSGLGISRFHGEEYSSSPGQVEPQHLAQDDAMAFHQVLGSCDALEEMPLDAEVSVFVDYEDAHSGTSRSAQASRTISELLTEGQSQPLAKAGAVVAWAELLKTLPADSVQAERAIHAVRAHVLSAIASLSGDSELQEIVGLLDKLSQIVE